MRTCRFQARRKVLDAVALLGCATILACQDGPYDLPEPQMDAHSFPKEVTLDVVDFVCGDDRVQGDESCEPGLWTPEACAAPLYTDGLVQCADDCRLSYEDCEGGACRNGIVESGEECDTRVGLNSVSCPDGEQCPACTIDCLVVDSPSCGNGLLELPTEECDGTVLAESIRRPDGVVELSRYDSATLACGADCRVILFDAEPAECGNGLVEAGENCDLANADAPYRTVDGERFACIDCDWQVIPGVCGDGILQPDFEQCDGENYLGDRTTCAEWFGPSFSPEDALGCTSSCEVDVSNCNGDGAGNEADDDLPESINGCTTASGHSTRTPGFWFIAALIGAGFASRRRIGHPRS